MAYEIPGQVITFEAGADLSAKQFYVVYLSSADTVNVATSNSTQVPIGILQNDPESGKPASVCVSGVSKAEAGGAISAGDIVTFGSDGRVTSLGGATGVYAVGVALQAATAAGQVIPVLIKMFAV